jgi:hypothetical protein
MFATNDKEVSTRHHRNRKLKAASASKLGRRSIGPRTALGIVLAMTLALCPALAGCQQASPKPEDSLKQFLGAVRYKRGQVAWDLLSAKSQVELKKRAAELAEIQNTAVQSKPSELLFGQLELIALRTPESISVVSPIDSTASLQVSLENGQTTSIEMIREGPAWKVDLFASLSLVPTMPKPNTALDAATSDTATASSSTAP